LYSLTGIHINDRIFLTSQRVWQPLSDAGTGLMQLSEYWRAASYGATWASLVNRYTVRFLLTE